MVSLTPRVGGFRGGSWYCLECSVLKLVTAWLRLPGTAAARPLSWCTGTAPSSNTTGAAMRSPAMRHSVVCAFCVCTSLSGHTFGVFLTHFCLPHKRALWYTHVNSGSLPCAPCLRGSTVSYAGVAHFPKRSLEYSLNLWGQSKKKKRKVGYFSLMATVTAVTTVFSYTGALRFFLSPKTQIMSQNKPYFPLTMPDCCRNLLLDVAPPGVGCFQGGHRKVAFRLGAVRVLCRNDLVLCFLRALH